MLHLLLQVLIITDSLPRVNEFGDPLRKPEYHDSIQGAVRAQRTFLVAHNAVAVKTRHVTCCQQKKQKIIIPLTSGIPRYVKRVSP